MKSKSAQKGFMPGTSRGARKATTLLAQMGDLERGERIKQLRLERHLTQPAVADMVGVTLRAYQEWEAGGGIQWENVKRLSAILSVEPEYVMRGITPAVAPELNGTSTPTDQLDRLEDQVRMLTEQIEAMRLELAGNVLEVLTRLDAIQPQQQATRRRRSA